MSFFAGLGPPLAVAPSPAGSSFNPDYPTTVPNLIGWWDATKISGQADGSLPTGWTDSSGSGHDLQTVTGGDDPTYYDTTAAKLVNGRPTVWWGTSTGAGYMRIPSNPSVAQPYSWVFIAGSQSTGTAGAYLWATQANSGDIPNMSLQASGRMVINAGTAVNGPTVTDTAAHCLIGIFNGASSVCALDGVLGTVGNAGTDSMGIATFTVIGVSGTSPGQPWAGPICEAMLYAGDITTYVAGFHSYSHGKWGTP